jgi:hypothetical protein
MPKSDQPDMDHAEAARIRHEHEKARKDAIEAVAERNRQAHEAAKKDRRAQERFRLGRNRDMYM